MAFVRVKVINGKNAGQTGVLIESLDRHHTVKTPDGEIYCPIGSFRILSISPEGTNKIPARAGDRGFQRTAGFRENSR